MADGGILGEVPDLAAKPTLTTGTVTFIGDVHGWDDRLQRVLDQAEGLPVLMGDLIDRGPDAPAVLDRVHALCAGGKALCLLGNHEFALVRGLGVPELGIPADPILYRAWYERYGGDAVTAAYGVRGGDPRILRLRLGDHLPWLAALPWVLEGDADGRRWIAVHAGLGTAPLAPQLAELREPSTWWRRDPVEQPPALYAKPRAFLTPRDLPRGTHVVSGHTPQREVVVSDRRILCDTTGGLRNKELSGVVWPSGRIIIG
jgi:hypothetical protein